MCVFIYVSNYPQICHKWLEKCYLKDKFNKSTRRICLIYFSMTPFNDNIKFRLWNLNNNDLMLINFHISLKTKRFFSIFWPPEWQNSRPQQLLLNINNFSNKMVDALRKFHQISLKIVQVITIAVSNPVILLWMPSKDVRALPADTLWRYDLPPSCCWLHLLIFCTHCPYL